MCVSVRACVQACVALNCDGRVACVTQRSPTRQQQMKQWVAGHDVPPPDVDDMVAEYRRRTAGVPLQHTLPTLKGKIAQKYPLRSGYTGLPEPARDWHVDSGRIHTAISGSALYLCSEVLPRTQQFAPSMIHEGMRWNVFDR